MQTNFIFLSRSSPLTDLRLITSNSLLRSTPFQAKRLLACVEVHPCFIGGNLAFPIFKITGVECGLQEKAYIIIEQLLHRVGILSKDLDLLAIFDASE